ncbi:uncharacterized protein TNCV_2266081 [Trichonephila clavipes]|nr:uncharacterized protein TNCV_2266081 [Trichonephila clavipes]
MITNFFIPELNNHDVQELWFQQDGATCHTARATIDLLKDTFGDRLISRFGPVNWPPRSCDLTPLDYFLYNTRSIGDGPQSFEHSTDLKFLSSINNLLKSAKGSQMVSGWSTSNYIQLVGGVGGSHGVKGYQSDDQREDLALF